MNNRDTELSLIFTVINLQNNIIELKIIETDKFSSLQQVLSDLEAYIHHC